MPSGFEPLRRKLGMMTLVMACVFTAGWLRSRSFIDLIDLRWTPDFSASESLVSVNGCLGWSRQFHQSEPLDHQSDANASFGLSIRFPEWRAYVRDGVISELPATSAINTPFANWCWNSCRIGIGIEDQVSSGGMTYSRERCWAIPYWSIVIPLIVVSAWLPFTNPRPKPTTDPTQSSTHRPIQF